MLFILLLLFLKIIELLGSLKAHGLDGFNDLFFKSHWVQSRMDFVRYSILALDIWILSF